MERHPFPDAPTPTPPHAREPLPPIPSNAGTQMPPIDTSSLNGKETLPTCGDVRMQAEVGESKESAQAIGTTQGVGHYKGEQMAARGKGEQMQDLRENNLPEFNPFGRPGHGAPLVTNKGDLLAKLPYHFPSGV